MSHRAKSPHVMWQRATPSRAVSAAVEEDTPYGLARILIAGTRRREIQQLMHEKAMFAPIIKPAFLTGVGPRLGDVPSIAGHPYFSPYEDMKLK